MHRPLETTFWMRLKQFMKGAFLYNTIYWRRASDDLDIQRMSREERANLRPQRNLDIIRPRERPRPVVNGAVLNLPPEYTERSDLHSAAQVSDPHQAAATPDEPDPNETVEIHRRKKRRRGRHSKVMPKRYYEPTSGGKGLLGWLFKK